MAAVGEQLELVLSDLARDGQAVGRHQGQVVFVDGGLPGETVRARITGTAQRHLRARLVAVVSPSPQRRRPPCILADHCGGCSLQPLSDDGQQIWKQQLVEQTLQRIGQQQLPFKPLLASPTGLGYRNRAVIPLERTETGQLRAGYYRRGSHRIVNMNRCPVLDPRLDALVEPLKSDLEASGWRVDRHGQAGGGLRHLALRLGVHTGQVLITLIATDTDLPGLDALAAHWMERWPEVVGVVLNLQPEPSNLLMGRDTRLIRGQAWLHERFAGLSLRLAADTFFQVNTLQAERVVPLLLQGLTTQAGRLVDAYCGIGTFSLPLAAAGWSVLGLELHPAAVALARHNAEANGLSQQARFLQADVAEALGAHLGEADALLLDPPRKGLAAAVLEAILAQPVPRLLYLSCDPATLARDLAQLSGVDAPYELVAVQPIDLFPNTSHVEVLATLVLR